MAHLAIGGVALRAERANDIRRDLEDIKTSAQMTREVKWSNVKARRDDVHKAFVDYLFYLVENGLAHFHVRFSPMGEYDHSLSGKRRKIDTISKAYYQLLLHRAGQFYGGSCDLFIYPDKGECTEQLPSFLGRLNDNCSERYGHSSFRLIEPRDSERDVIQQMLDVSLGALGAVRNGRHEVLATAKKEMALYVLQKTGRATMAGNSAIADRKFSVWNVVPAWRKG